ncbi:MAG: 4Fe-4S binding protein [Ignavibacteriaceae bacterium]|nr:4Fe-4S binding protein [Ignavibacteriaceae bacterium]
MKNKIRVSFQLIILALIGYVAVRPLFDANYLADFESYCPFGGLASLGSKLNQGTMSCNMSEVQVVLGIGLLVGVIVVGKLFCSYVCPIGSITEWLGKIGEKLKIRFEIPNKIDRPLRALKYLILFAALYFTMTSSELFCKEFDPYFASVNLFSNSDLVLYLAIPAFVITILGAIFFRLFWCKYLCPLGALSNIFLNVIAAGGVIILFIILNALGAEISYVYLVAALVLVGLVTELGFMRSFLMPAPKIVRNETTCTDCGFCDQKCPQGIQISAYAKVNHVDCNLCTDCVYHCPVKNSLSISEKKTFKYLSPVAVVVFIIISLGAASDFEFTTISEKWDDFDKVENMAVYEQTGIKNVKCYGSAMSLKNNLVNVAGIHGIDAYAKSHTVKIYYDPKEISEKKVKAAIFTPIKMEIKKIKDDKLDSLAVWEAGVYGLFDLIDFNNLFYTLRENKGVYGFETHFGEPVITNVFYDPSVTNADKIKKQIEMDEITVKKPKATEKIDLNFKVDGNGTNKGYINIDDYKQKIFRTYDRKFNDYKKYDLEKLSVFVFPMPEAGIPSLRRYFGSLTSHLSADNGIVRLSTRYIDEPKAFLYFDPAQTNIEKIKEALTKKTLTVFTSETQTKDLENPFNIKPEGKVIKASDAKIDDEIEL